MDKPFAKVRILDLSRMLSAPYSSHLMRLLGAEVVKVEDPDGGDPYRYMT
ncbi:MAG: CoA transferase, partial [Alphaproteobacteria bacterium]|nr:CoA transferase [Alphaproteobacteria bacterium]